MTLLILAAAFAGELMVLTASPVVVQVDGTAVDYTPNTMVVQVSGLEGVHKVEILSVTGKSKAVMNVNVPAQGGASLAFDGMNLVMASAGTTSSTTAVATTEVVSRGPVVSPEPEKPKAMSATAMSALLRAVEDASFAADKLDVVRTAAKGNWFTIAQVGQLVDAMDFGEGRVGTVKICKDRVVDPENAFQLGEHFDFSSEKDEALGLFQ